MKLAANLTMLFNEADFLDRFRLAAQAGFHGVEFLFPYAYPAQTLAAQLDAHRLELVLHNLPAGDWAGGERGIACHPDRRGEFEDGVGVALAYAQALGVKQLNCLAGILPAGVSADAAHATLVANLRFAAHRLKEEGIALLIEPINTFDIPGFFLNGSRQALDIIRETGSDNLFLQYDIYHMQRMEGELAATIRAYLPLIRHIQLADNPGRGEPGTGEINYRYLLPLLDDIGYTGWVGCEYKPRAGTVAGLGWIAEQAETLA
ncbi:hydroxypyruvate isomerase [Pseudoduganella flava]|uniref:Hydroxypyruvate isomerase n=1 Tax=Pseudoduganella flava TaxID=871742 RepID=A0A562PLP3_9BURK|nr:hydroxypyruvate isomerase [Pseudoduganella flava]QGZ40929.1 hydroxypyruvate isomerase [Pseudoduganella flava]TWI45391.1 hydroxypyruvate isomerase [Pseudoduganella flava]